MRKIKIGIVGIGHLGSRHLKVYSQLTDAAEIIGICDVQKERTLKLAHHYNVPFFADYKDLAEKIDAVSICVPTNVHFVVAQFFLNQKIHTFIEKPITSTLAEADQLINIAQKNKCKLQVGHIERFNAAFQFVQRLTPKPLFIECHRLNTFPNRSLDIGVVMDLMIHDIDIVLGLIKSPIKDLHAVGAKVLTSLEDIASARLIFEDGCVCNLTASRISDDVMRKIRLFQDNAYISLDYVQQEAYIYRKYDHRISKHRLPIEKEEPLRKEIEHFLTCIQEDKIPLIAGPEAREALKVALAITQQIWDNRKDSSLS